MAAMPTGEGMQFRGVQPLLGHRHCLRGPPSRSHSDLRGRVAQHAQGALSGAMQRRLARGSGGNGVSA